MTLSGLATISDDGKYRYVLRRKWDGHPWFGHNKPYLVWIMLNPSTADAFLNDPTITRCIDFTKQFGYTRLVVINLYARRATKPENLWPLSEAQRIGPHNHIHIRKALRTATQQFAPVICAWGTKAPEARIKELLSYPEANKFHCLSITKGGQPGHPLYLPKANKLQPWIPPWK